MHPDDLQEEKSMKIEEMEEMVADLKQSVNLLRKWEMYSHAEEVEQEADAIRNQLDRKAGVGSITIYADENGLFSYDFTGVFECVDTSNDYLGSLDKAATDIYDMALDRMNTKEKRTDV